MRKFLALPAFALIATGAIAQEATDGPGPNMVIEVAAADGTAKGRIVLDLLPDVAPNHVERLVTLARDGKYDGVVFHRVIDGFMAQTGDVQYGRHDGDTSRAGMGGSDLPDLAAEFSNTSFQAGTVGMARSQSPDSANSQFFIDLAPATFLDGQYTVVGQLVEGWDVLNSIKKGNPSANGAVDQPDYMARVTIEE
ncbi:MAG: peptidylprolyl isomerase [Paracoccus sp. (in: a-proteobacteria)]|uniref:peptidylprolyl isomerase n=1 Tax=Paracoccus sp. TaxID=267 RepID=UPI0026DFAAFC|nr:peptidylprolyl isomerase [Paracoccus sp. (in: a-proteobacteria)]MDO5614490.1 peptidylprolyl isomerase [Paracoccus sp. (in: a-proteobacteria)]